MIHFTETRVYEVFPQEREDESPVVVRRWKIVLVALLFNLTSGGLPS
jgi:hypothetical protein